MICRNGWRRAFQEQEAGWVGRRVATLLKLELKDWQEPDSHLNMPREVLKGAYALG